MGIRRTLKFKKKVKISGKHYEKRGFVKFNIDGKRGLT